MEQTINSTKTEALAQLWTGAAQRLADTVISFKENDFNRVPFAGSWTGAQVSEHVIKSMALIHQMVNDTITSTARGPEDHIPFLSSIMENMVVKTQSAPNLVPGEEPMSPAEIQNGLLERQNDLLQDIHRLDLSKTCTVSEFPGLGFLTRIELISFCIFHTERHNRQLRNIYKIITGNNI
ncbi:MAG TPA: DinB family protein [Edaphocola sp.]|nr:DinB family protein [Edaphocola sp.]